MSLVRAQDWWQFKIPPILALCYVAIVELETQIGEAIMYIGLALLTIIALACYGFVLNDCCDIEQDRLAGKPNQMAGRNWVTRASLLSFFFLLGLVPAALLGGQVPFVVLGLNYALPTLYSVRPVRLKERGVLAVLADAGGVHVLPGLYVLVLAPSLDGSRVPLTLLVTAGLWSALFGLRGILFHMIEDRKADERGEVETLGRQLSSDRVLPLIIRVELLFEGAVFVILLLMVRQATVMLLIGFGAYLTICMIKRVLGWRWWFSEQKEIALEKFVPLVDNYFYQTWFPTILLIHLVAGDRRWLVVLIVHICLFHRGYLDQWKDLRLFVANCRAAIQRGLQRFFWGFHLEADAPSAGRLGRRDVFLRWARVNIDCAGDSPWMVRLVKLPHGVSAGDRCRVIFKARAEATRNIALVAWERQPPWENVGLYREFTLSPRRSRLTATFEPEVSGDRFYLGVWLGQSTVGVDLTRISIVASRGSGSYRQSGSD